MPSRTKDLLIRFLRFTERYTKTDMVYLVHGGFWTTMGQVIAILSAIPLSIAFANLISHNDYGIYRYILTLLALISAFSLTGLPTALARSVAKGFEGALKKAFLLNLRWSIPMIGIALAGAGYYTYQENYVLGFGLLLIAIFAPLLNSGNLFTFFLEGKREFRIHAAYSNRRTIIHTVAMLVTLFTFPNLLVILSVFFATQAATALYYYRKTLREQVSNHTTDPEMAHLSKHLSIMKMLNVFSDRLDSILLFQFIGAAELAIYSFAQLMPDAMNRLAKNISTLAFPKFVSRANPQGILIKSLMFTLVILVGVLLYVFLVPYIFAVFFPAYMASVPFSQALALLLLTNASLPSTYIDAQNVIKIRYIINFSTNAVKIVAVVIGVTLFGIWGAIAARFISRIFSAAINIIALRWFY